MDQEAFSKYLKDRYQDQVDWYDRKAGQNQKIYRRFQWALIWLSAVTPAGPARIRKEPRQRSPVCEPRGSLDLPRKHALAECPEESGRG